MTDPRLFSAEDFRRRVDHHLSGAALPHVGDHLINPELSEMLLKMERRQAAVLVPVVHREPEATVLFTERTSELRTHAGQIAFPGGRVDPEDASVEAAALREAEEEIGLSREFVETVGRGPDYLTGSGYHVALVVALVRPGFMLTLNPAEVASTFEVPLSYLMNPSNFRTGTRIWNGFERSFYEIPFDGHRIWGITAGMVYALYERLYGDGHAA